MTSSASGKRSRVRELLAVVEHVRAESDRVRETRQVIADVAGADDVQPRRRFERLDVDLHLPAAHEPVFLREVVVEVVLDQLRLARLDGFLRLPERVVLVAAAADGADRAAVGEDEHLRADALRRRAVGRHDGHERGVLAALERLRQRLEDFLGHV